MIDDLISLRGSRFVMCECIVCGCVFIVSETVIKEQRRMGGFHWCPNGHQQGWNKDGSEFDKMRRERDLLAQKIAQKNDEIAAVRRKAEKALMAADMAQKEIDRQKKRAKAGVCSCCHRSFPDLKRHMETKHKQAAE